MKRTVDVALTQLDVKEATGANDGTPAERYGAGDKLPWCASFLLWCNAQSEDAKLAPTKAAYYRLRAVSELEAEMKRRGSWRALTSKDFPTGNCLLFFRDRGASDAAVSGRHVGIVVETQVLSSGKHLVHTVEGNVGNRVQRLKHDLSNPKTVARITGFALI